MFTETAPPPSVATPFSRKNPFPAPLLIRRRLDTTRTRLDEMLALCQAVSGLPHRRVIGEAPLLNTARWKHYVSERLNVTPAQVEGVVLGSHGETMVPVPSLTRVDGAPLRELLDGDGIESVVEETRGCAAEIIAYLKTGSGYHAAAAAGEATVRAIVQDSGVVLPVCAWLMGEYGLRDVYVGVPVVLGREGVRDVVELPLDEGELAALRRAARIVDARQNEAEETILAASTRATGRSARPARSRSRCRRPTASWASTATGGRWTPCAKATW